MSVSQGTAWLIAWLVITPAVAVGADLLQRDREALTFQLPDLRDGDRAVYDVTVTSTFSDLAATQEEHLEIDVEGPDHVEAPNGKSVGVLWFELNREPAPWDASMMYPTVDGYQRVTASHAVDSLEAVRLSDGRTIWVTEEQENRQWFLENQDQTFLHSVDTQRWHKLPMPVHGMADAFGVLHNQTYRYTEQGAQASASESGTGDVAARETLDGATVYRIDRTTDLVSHGQAFRCDLDVPRVPFEDYAATKKHREKNVHTITERTQWLDPDLPFPRLASCTATFYAGATHGEPLGTIQVVAHLVEFQRGNVPIVVDWAPDLWLPATNTLPATSVGEDLLPPDPDSLFRFPLSDAHLAVAETQDVRVSDFRDDAPRPFLVVRATYSPGQPVPCPELDDLGEIPCELADETGTEQDALYQPYWYLLLENKAGKRMWVHVTRTVSDDGSAGSPAEVTALETVSTPEPHSHAEGVPHKLVAIADVMSAWLEREETTIEAWRAGETAYFHYDLDTEPDWVPDEVPDEPWMAFEPRYRFVASIDGAGDDAGAPEATDSGPGYDSEPSDLPTQGLFPDVGAADLAPTASSGSADASGDGTIHASYYDVYRARDAANLEHGVDQSMFEMTEAPKMRAEYHDPMAGLGEAPHSYTVALVAAGLTTAAFAFARGDVFARAARRLLFVAPFFTKLSKDQVLEHRTRDEMINFVTGNPGVGTEDVRKHCDIGWGTAVYHLAALEQSGMLTSLKAGGHRHWFPARNMDPATKKAIATLRSPAAKRLYDAVGSAPGRTQQELAAALGVTHGAVIFQVRKLERAGLLRKERDGRFVRYYVGEQGTTPPPPPPRKAAPGATATS